MPRQAWHRCQRWFDRGYPCPYRSLGVDREEEPPDDELDKVREGARGLEFPDIYAAERNKKVNAVSKVPINIEDYINETPPIPIGVPIPGKVAARVPVPAGAGPVPLFKPQPPGVPTGPSVDSGIWESAGVQELASGITAGTSPPFDALGVGAAHSLWKAPPNVPLAVQAKAIHVPRFGQPPLPLFENELARATAQAAKGAAPALPPTTLGVRAKVQGLHQGFGKPPAEIAAETKGVTNRSLQPRSNYSQRQAEENTWGITAVIASAMAAVAIYALAKGGMGGAAAIEQAITQRIPDNRGAKRGTAAKGSVRPGGQVFDFWDMLNGIGFQ